MSNPDERRQYFNDRESQAQGLPIATELWATLKMATGSGGMDVDAAINAIANAIEAIEERLASGS